MKYRAEIDGLRAFSVVPVILYHAGFEFFSGGFVGVDIFFVISGYLITTILLEDIENDRFSIIDFYERRARRILPALVFVMLIIAMISWLFLTPSAMKLVYQQLVSNAFFLSNVHYTLTWGYFESWKLPPVFLNTWSLAVEEQFYLIVPFLIFFLRKRIKLNVLVLAILALGSLLWAGYANSLYPVATYYLLPSRLWELTFGVLLSYLVKYNYIEVCRWRLKFSKVKGDVILLLVISLFYFFYSKDIPYPSFWTLPVVIVASLIILLVDGSSSAGRVLSTRAFVYIGKLSYPLYLLHFPLIILSKELLVPYISEAKASILAVLLTLVLSVFVFHVVELKFRKKEILYSQKSMLFCSVLALTFVAFLGFLGHKNIIVSRSFIMNEELSHLFEMPHMPKGLSEKDCAARNAKTECSLIDGRHEVGERKFYIIGDSFSANLISPIWELLKDEKTVSLKARVTYACSYMPSGFSEWNGECGLARKFVESLSSDEVTDVIFHIDFVGHLKSNRVESVEDELASLTLMFESLVKRNIRVHVIGHREVFNFEPIRGFVYPWLAPSLKAEEVPQELHVYYQLWDSMGFSVFNKKTELNLNDAYKNYLDSGHLSAKGSIDLLKRFGLVSSDVLLLN